MFRISYFGIRIFNCITPAPSPLAYRPSPPITHVSLCSSVDPTEFTQLKSEANCTGEAFLSDRIYRISRIFMASGHRLLFVFCHGHTRTHTAKFYTVFQRAALILSILSILSNRPLEHQIDRIYRICRIFLWPPAIRTIKKLALLSGRSPLRK